MEPASLAIGAAGLVIQLHEAVLGCLEAIRNFRDAGEHNALLNCKLQIEQHILARWGQRCELAEGRLEEHLPDAEDQEMVLMILRNMMGIVAETETLKKKYGMSYVSTSDVDTSAMSQMKFSFLVDIQRKQPVAKLGTLTAAFVRARIAPDSPTSASTDADDIYQQCIRKGRTTMSFMRKYRWIVVDSKRFEEMIYHLKDLNKSLYRLTQHLFPASTAESDILEATPDQYLEIVEQATAKSYPRASFGTNIRLTIAQTESADATRLTASGPQRNLRIQIEQLHFRGTAPGGRQTRALATYRSILGRSRAVLVEWRPFVSGLTQHTREASIKRTDNLARILQKKPNKAAAEYFRVLECAGYCVADQEVGYVFDLPQGANSSHRPVSLEELLQGAEYPMDTPALEMRLDLCKALCNSIYWLHASNLVHKGIRSNNILFFVPEGEEVLRIREPYVTGFDHSRSDGPNDPTIAISAITPDDDRYRHPDAKSSSSSRRSTKIHDMYSLGLVLLEVAHWVQLKHLVNLRAGDEVKHYLSSNESRPIDDLDHLVGSRLQRIIKRCIKCDFQVDLNDPRASIILQDIFLHEIAAEVMKCSV